MTKKAYTRPCITVVRFRSERGYASSIIVNPPDLQIDLMINQQIDEMNYHNSIQDFEYHSTWIDDDGSFWL